MLTNSKEKGTVQPENKNGAEITKDCEVQINASYQNNQDSNNFKHISKASNKAFIEIVHEKYKDDLANSDDCCDHVVNILIDANALEGIE